jgi:hypothetical protein
VFFLWFLNTDKPVENTRRSRVFLEIRERTEEKSEEEHLLVFELTSQTNPYFKRKSRLKLEKFGCYLPPISKYWLNTSWIINEFENVEERRSTCTCFIYISDVLFLMSNHTGNIFCVIFFVFARDYSFFILERGECLWNLVCTLLKIWLGAPLHTHFFRCPTSQNAHVRD